MSESFSLLHEEGSYTKALYLKHLDQNEAHFETMTAFVSELVAKGQSLQKIIDDAGIEVKEGYNEHFNHIHAQYRSDEHDHYIWLNLYWIDRYSQYMSVEQAKDLHIAHEVFHLLETKNDMWYKSLRRRYRMRYSEVSAIYFSQLMSGLACHPYLYEYQSKIDHNEIEKDVVIDYLKEG